MATFQDIVKEYIEIESLDVIRLHQFYIKHKDFFFATSYSDKSTESKSIVMLIEVACSYAFAERNQEALSLINKIKSQLHNNIIPPITENINRLYLWAGYANFNLKKYRAALTNFKAHKPNEKEKPSIEIVIRLCQDKLINQFLSSFAIVGIVILIIKYATKWVFTDYYSLFIDRLGWIGAISLIAYGLFIRSSDKKK